MTKNEHVTMHPPDGGWGFVVVAGAFSAQMLTHGILYSFGIMFIALTDAFHGTKAETAWIGSIQTANLYLIGPIAAALTNRYGCRCVTIVGTMLTASGFLLSMLAQGLHFLYFSLGIVAGCGHGLVFLPAIVSVTQYFSKWRAIATSLSLCGAGVGAFLFSPLTRILLDRYGWKGTLMIEAGIYLNCIICGAVFRPLNIIKSYPSKDKALKLNQRPLMGKVISIEITPKGEANVQDEREHDECDEERHFISRNAMQCNNSNEFDGAQCRLNTEASQCGVEHRAPDNKSHSFHCCTYLTVACSKHVKLLKHRTFLIFIISQFLFFLGFYVPFTYIPSLAQEEAIDPHRSAWIVSTIGISSMVGRVFFGYLSDRPDVDRLTLYSSSLLISGVITCVVPAYVHFVLLIVCSVVYGAFTGVILSLTSVILVDIMGIEKIADTFGICSAFSGVAVLVGPPIAGLIYDRTESYTMSFIFSGSCMTLAALLMFVIIYIMKRQRR